MKYIFIFSLMLISIAGISQRRLLINGNKQIIAPQNLLLYSEQLDNSATWFPNDATVLANQANDIAGAPTLDRITFNSDYSNLQSYITVQASTQYTFSFEGKRGTNTEGYLNFQDASNGNATISGNNNFYAAINGTTPTRVSYTFTTPPGCTSLLVTFTTFTSHGTMFAGRAQLNKGATIKPYATTTTTTVP